MPYKFDTEKKKIGRDNDKRFKLTQDEREEIKELYGSMPQRTLAKKYGVSRRLITFISCPEKYKQNELHPLINKTFGELYERTQFTTKWLLKHKQVDKVRRFWNSEIKKNKNLVIKTILEDIKELYEGI